MLQHTSAVAPKQMAIDLAHIPTMDPLRFQYPNNIDAALCSMRPNRDT